MSLCDSLRSFTAKQFMHNSCACDESLSLDKLLCSSSLEEELVELHGESLCELLYGLLYSSPSLNGSLNAEAKITTQLLGAQ